MSLCFCQVQYQITDIVKCKKTAKNYLIFFSGSDETNMIGTSFWKDYVKSGSKNYQYSSI